MSFERQISEDITIKIDDDGYMTVMSLSLGEAIVVSAEEFDLITEAYEDWQFQPVEDDR